MTKFLYIFFCTHVGVLVSIRYESTEFFIYMYKLYTVTMGYTHFLVRHYIILFQFLLKFCVSSPFWDVFFENSLIFWMFLVFLTRSLQFSVVFCVTSKGIWQKMLICMHTRKEITRHLILWLKSKSFVDWTTMFKGWSIINWDN